MYYAITDEETGRYLSKRSVPIDTDGNTLYIAYSGRLGTDFFQSLYEAEKLLNLLLDRIRSCGTFKLLQIVIVNPDMMELGQQFVETLNVTKSLAIF